MNGKKYKYDEQEQGVAGEYENHAWLDNWLRLKVQQEQKEFNNLTREEAKKNVRSLTFVQLGLKGKVVIENFPDLTQLNLSNNELEEVIIRNCPDLKLVSLAHNQLTKLKIENCPSVKELYTSYNQLTSLEEVKIEELNNLLILSYDQNPLATEEKARLDGLGLKDTAAKARVDGPAQEWLDAKYPLDIRDSIEKLDISGLGLQGDLDLEGFTNLKQLDCSDNDLIGLNLDDCEELEYLECSNNYHLKEKQIKAITLLNLSKNKKLKEVYANHCGLEQINLTGLDKIESLSLTSNKLESLDLENQVNLLYLNVALNELKTLDLTSNVKLEQLLCYKNFLSELNLKHLSELESLYCYRNKLEKLDCSGLGKLKELLCSHNSHIVNSLNFDETFLWLKEINVNGCEALQILDCAENPGIAELTLTDLPNLSTLSCKQNAIENLVINNCKKLEYLDFSEQKSFLWENFSIHLNHLCPRSESRSVFNKVDINGSNNLKEVFYDKGTFVPDWDNYPNLELVGIGKNKKVREKNKHVVRYFVKKIDVLAYRNTEKIKEFLARGEENITLEELLELSGRKKDLQGIPNELRNQLYELGQKKLKEWLSIKKNHEKRKSEEIPTPPAEEESTELPPPSPPKRRKSEPEEPEKQNKDQIIIDLHEENEKLKSRIRELENSKGNTAEINKKREQIRKEIIDSKLDENKKQELLKRLKELINKNKVYIDNEVETSSPSHNYNLVWIPVIIGQAILLSALIYAYWCDWRKKRSL